MTFRYDFRLIQNRTALLEFIGLNAKEFDSVINFKTNAPPFLIDENGRVGDFIVPAFYAHQIPKKGKASGVRLVWEPILFSRHYKTLARRLESFFNTCLEGFPHPNVFGFRPGQNIRENALNHCGNKNLLKIDIKNFFPSISTKQVRNLFANLQVDSTVSDLLARFLTIEGALAPGLPTSPIVSNAISLAMDVQFANVAAQMNSVYSRYVDDLSFSGNGVLPEVETLQKIIEDYGFTIADDKTRLSKAGWSHFVTGLSVTDSKQPHVPRRMKRRIRQEVYYCEKFGLGEHLKHIGINSGRYTQSEINRIDGMVKYVSFHERNTGGKLKESWRKSLFQANRKVSFSSRRQDRPPFHIYLDEAEFVRGKEKVLCLCMVLTQHADRLESEGVETLQNTLADVWAAGSLSALRARGLHYADATEDLHLAYIKKLSEFPLEGYAAFLPLSKLELYKTTYIRLLGCLLRRRLMAAESQMAIIHCEKNSKVPQKEIKNYINKTFAALETENQRRPRSIFVEFVDKPHFGVSAPDFMLGVLGKYLRSSSVAEGKPESRERLMFERIRDKFGYILDADSWREYSRRNPIMPWTEVS